jgi:tRNA-splicing ligase RtcB
MTEEFTLNSNQVHVNFHVNDLDEKAKQKVFQLAKHPAMKGLISIMPDAHDGKACVIGTTCHFGNGVIPNVVGTDIGCGLTGYPLDSLDIDLAELDKKIRKVIPVGFGHRDERNGMQLIGKYGFSNLYEKLCATEKLIGYDKKTCTQIGTLGGGNHFVELGKTSEDTYWIFIHSGSRNFGLNLANHFQAKAKALCQKMNIRVPNEMEYLPLGDGMPGSEYLYHMNIAQEFAHANRITMVRQILEILDYPFEQENIVESVHNYISPVDNICRKGAISAYSGEEVIVPLNMAEGTIIGTGKGNKDFNFSAPHGAGRLFGRNVMKNQLKSNPEMMKEFAGRMEGIFSSSIDENTIDESPMAYKPYSMIEEYLKKTVDVKEIVRPIYNLKG